MKGGGVSAGWCYIIRLVSVDGTSLTRSSSSGKAHELVRVGIGGDKLGLLLGVQWWETVWAVGFPSCSSVKSKVKVSFLPSSGWKCNTQCDNIL